jgi:flagellar basal body-associated protein FliL
MDPLQNQQQPMMAEPKKSYGGIIGIIVIVILLVVGALYIWGGKITGKSPVQNADTTTNTQPKSDEVSAIEQDLSAEGNIDTNVDLSELN